jgi:hypothetical protein
LGTGSAARRLEHRRVAAGGQLLLTERHRLGVALDLPGDEQGVEVVVGGGRQLGLQRPLLGVRSLRQRDVGRGCDLAQSRVQLGVVGDQHGGEGLHSVTVPLRLGQLAAGDLGEIRLVRAYQEGPVLVGQHADRVLGSVGGGGATDHQQCCRRGSDQAASQNPDHPGILSLK